MGTVGAYDAKTHLPELLKRVEAGEMITITRHGMPVAILMPPEPARSSDTESVIRDLRSFRRGRRLGGKPTAREMIEEGRS